MACILILAHTSDHTIFQASEASVGSLPPRWLRSFPDLMSALDAVAQDRRHVCCEVRLDHDPVARHGAARQGEDVPDCRVEVEPVFGPPARKLREDVMASLKRYRRSTLAVIDVFPSPFLP
jgi:hypothetical protein